jgi:hypothetical protein
MNQLTLALALITTVALAETPAALKPLMVVPDKLVLKDDFTKSGPINKDQWQARQGTQWSIEGGVLRGKPSSEEFQASKTDHAGKEPRIAAPITPKECVAWFSVKFSGGEETALVPLVEFGHHVCRLRFSSEMTELLAEHDSVRVNEAKGFQYKPDTWYHMLWELKGDEVVIQIAGGPTLYARHASYAETPATGAAGLGIAGPRDGMVEIDNVSIFTTEPGVQAGWESKRKTLNTYKPVELQKKAKGKGKAKQ